MKEPSTLFTRCVGHGWRPSAGVFIGLLFTACAWAADEHDIVGVLDELATMKLTHQCLVYLTAGGAGKSSGAGGLA